MDDCSRTHLEGRCVTSQVHRHHGDVRRPEGPALLRSVLERIFPSRREDKARAHAGKGVRNLLGSEALCVTQRRRQQLQRIAAAAAAEVAAGEVHESNCGRD